MGFSSQEYWGGLTFPPPRDLPDPGMEPVCLASPALQADSLPQSHRGSPEFLIVGFKKFNTLTQRLTSGTKGMSPYSSLLSSPHFSFLKKRQYHVISECQSLFRNQLATSLSMKPQISGLGLKAWMAFTLTHRFSAPLLCFRPAPFSQKPHCPSRCLCSG